MQPFITRTASVDKASTGSSDAAYHVVPLPSFDRDGYRTSCISAGCFLGTPHAAGAMPSVGRMTPSVGGQTQLSRKRQRPRVDGSQHVVVLASARVGDEGNTPSREIKASDARQPKNREGKTPIKKCSGRTGYGSRGGIGVGKTMLRRWSGFQQEFQRDGRDSAEDGSTRHIGVAGGRWNEHSRNHERGESVLQQEFVDISAPQIINSTRESRLIEEDGTFDTARPEEDEEEVTASSEVRDSNQLEHQNHARDKHVLSNLSIAEASIDRFVPTLPKPSVPLILDSTNNGSHPAATQSLAVDSGAGASLASEIARDHSPVWRSSGGGGGRNEKHKGMQKSKRSATAISWQLQALIAAYANAGLVGSTTAAAPAGSERTMVGANFPVSATNARTRGKRVRGGRTKGESASSGEDRCGDEGGRSRRKTSVGLGVAGVPCATRMRRLEAAMEAALERPVTYEEQARQERLAHLRMTYTVRTRIFCRR